MVQPLLNTVLPVVVAIGALALRPQVGTLDTEQISLIYQLPWLLCAAAVALSVVLNSTRDLLLSLIVALFYWIIQSHLQVSLSEPASRQVFTALSILFPVVLASLILLPELPLRHRSNLLFILWLPIIGFLLWVTTTLWPAELKTFSEQLFGNTFLNLRLSVVSTALYTAVLLLALFVSYRRTGHYECSAIGVTLLSFITLAWLGLDHISAINCSAMAGLLLINQVRSLLDLAYRDELTLLKNRRALMRESRSLGKQYAIAMADIDHFKNINDSYGHDTGDQVLKLVARILGDISPKGNVFRYGGEEFCLLFRGKTAEEVQPLLDELGKSVANYDMHLRDKSMRPKNGGKGAAKRGATRRKSKIRVTISMGVADSTDVDDSSGKAGSPDQQWFSSAIKLADKALYKAKETGRNRVVRH